MFNDSELLKVINNETIGTFFPYLNGTENDIEGYIKSIVADLNRSSTIKAEADYSSYGSGYASYVDIFCSKKDGSSTTQKGGVFWIEGISLYISRLAPVACFGATQLTRHKDGGSYDFLRPNRLEILPKGEWDIFINEIKCKLGKYNINFIDKMKASKLLSFEVKIATILNEGPYTTFDALFYWED